MKKVIAACVDQILEFDTRKEINEFVEKIEYQHQQYNISNDWQMPDGKYRIRIQKQYNSSPLLDEELVYKHCVSFSGISEEDMNSLEEALNNEDIVNSTIRIV